MGLAQTTGSNEFRATWICASLVVAGLGFRRGDVIKIIFVNREVEIIQDSCHVIVKKDIEEWGDIRVKVNKFEGSVLLWGEVSRRTRDLIVENDVFHRRLGSSNVLDGGPEVHELVR